MKRNLDKRTLRIQESEQEASQTHCHLTLGSDSRLPTSRSVRIRSMVEQAVGACIMKHETYLDGGEVLHCCDGRIRIQLGGRKGFEVRTGETCIVYPDQRVTVEALQKRNVLLSVVLEGDGVAAYFDQCEFCNGMHGHTSAQRIAFEELKLKLAAANGLTTAEVLTILSEAFLNFAQDLRENGHALIMNAIRCIRENLKGRSVRLSTLYDQLGVGHTTLHRAFAVAGLGSPAEFVRREQMRLVKRLLQTTLKPLAEIAEETGFVSVTHFANSVKRITGKTASEIRRMGKIVK